MTTTNTDAGADGGLAPANDAGQAMDAGLVVDAGAQMDAGTAMDAGVPDAPVLLAAMMVSHGTNSVSWRLPTSGCSTVQLNRKQDQGAWSVVKTLTGVATSTQDLPGHATGTTFCYTVTCVSGGGSSLPSNEKCVSQ